MDSIRSKNFWRGTGDKFKYHIVNWGAVCRPKDYRGLGVINTRLMNECFLCKWWWRMSRAKDELWFRILKAKYFPRGEFRDIMPLKGSQFWKSLHKVRSLFHLGVVQQIGNGEAVFFWKDVWLGSCPLKIRYGRLFNITSNPDITVADCFVDGVWNITFIRQFGREEDMWKGLKNDLYGVEL